MLRGRTPGTPDCTSRARCVPGRGAIRFAPDAFSSRLAILSSVAASCCSRSQGCGGRSSRRGWRSAPSGSSARRARRPLRRPACYRYAEGHQGGASRRRWPGVSAGLCLGRPARRTPGHTPARHADPVLYATVFLGSRCPARGHCVKSARRARVACTRQCTFWARADAAPRPARLAVGEQMTAATSRRYQHVRATTFT